MKTVYRGEVYYAELSPVIGSEQGGIRPVLILQNNTGNRHSPTTIIAPITSVQKKSSLPTHIVIDYDFLESVSVVLLEQIRTIDKERLSDCLGRISVQDMQRVEAAMAVSLGMRWRHDREELRRTRLWTESAPPAALHGADLRGGIPTHFSLAGRAL